MDRKVFRSGAAGALFALALIVMALGAPLPPPVAAVGLAQQDACTDPAVADVAVQGATWKAQTFAPGAQYAIHYVDLDGANLGGTTTLHIQATVNGVPSGQDLASVSVTTGTRFALTSPLTVSQGVVYALVLSNTGGSYRWSYTASTTCYPNPAGHPYTSLNDGAAWSIDMVDFKFVINDTPPAPPPVPPVPITTPTVLVIAFPLGTPTYDPAPHTAALIEKLAEASTYHKLLDPTARPYLGFQLYGGEIVRAAATPPRFADGKYDIAWIYAQYDICARVRSGAIDEVWLWDAGQGGFPEWLVTGPEWTQTMGFNAPDCGKQLTTMIFNYNRDIALALHSFNHRLEGVASRYFACDLFTENWPWTGWPAQCAGLVSDRYGFVTRPSAANGYVGACGDVHHPPNITDNHDYDFNNTATVQSICEDWSQDGSAVAQPISCQRWGCTEEGFQIWWVQNMPGYNNTNRDRNGRPMENWLAYLFGSPRHQVFIPLTVR